MYAHGVRQVTKNISEREIYKILLHTSTSIIEAIKIYRTKYFALFFSKSYNRSEALRHHELYLGSSNDRWTHRNESSVCGRDDATSAIYHIIKIR